jgi:hypothetical protein
MPILAVKKIQDEKAGLTIKIKEDANQILIGALWTIAVMFILLRRFRIGLSLKILFTKSPPLASSSLKLKRNSWTYHTTF